MAGDGDADRLGADFAVRRLHAGAGAVLHDESGDLAVLDDVDTEPVRRARVAPGNRVVTRGSASSLPYAAVRQIARVERLRHQRQALADLVGSPELGVYPVELHRLASRAAISSWAGVCETLRTPRWLSITLKLSSRDRPS